jgi:hypothetical protein
MRCRFNGSTAFRGAYLLLNDVEPQRFNINNGFFSSDPTVSSTASGFGQRMVFVTVPSLE